MITNPDLSASSGHSVGYSTDPHHLSPGIQAIFHLIYSPLIQPIPHQTGKAVLWETTSKALLKSMYTTHAALSLFTEPLSSQKANRLVRHNLHLSNSQWLFPKPSCPSHALAFQRKVCHHLSRDRSYADCSKTAQSLFPPLPHVCMIFAFFQSTETSPELPRPFKVTLQRHHLLPSASLEARNKIPPPTIRKAVVRHSGTCSNSSWLITFVPHVLSTLSLQGHKAADLSEHRTRSPPACTAQSHHSTTFAPLAMLPHTNLGYLHLILTLDSPLPHCSEPLSSPLHSAIFLFQSRSHKCAAIAQLKLFQLLWHPHDMNQNRLALLLTCQLQKRQSITHQAAGDLKENWDNSNNNSVIS